MTTRKWGQETLVNTSQTGSQSDVDITAVGNGFVAVWTNDDSTSGDGSASAIMMQRFDAVGNKIGLETVVNTVTAGGQSQPTITTLGNGSFVVSWTDQSANPNLEIAYRRFNADGTAIDATDKVLALSGSQESAVITAINTGALAGGFAVSFRQTTGVQDIAAHYVDAAGNPAGSLLNIATTANSERDAAVVMLNQGNLAFSWHDSTSGHIEYAIRDQAGVIVRAESIASNVGNAQSGNPVMAALENGGFVIVWTDASLSLPDIRGQSVRGQIFNPAGVPVGINFQVNGLTSSNQATPDIIALRDGGFAVVYESGLEKRGQLFNADGSKNGVEFQINTTSGGLDPVLTLMADGRLAVAWKGSDSNGDGIVMQIIDPRDGIVDGTAGVDLLYGHDAVGDVMTGFGGTDTLHGLAGADILFGGDGIDTLNGGRGDDTLYGDAGADVMTGGLGADHHNGGAGTDLAGYFLSKSGVIVNFVTGDGFGGEAEGDTFEFMESIQGSNFNDTLTLGAFAGQMTGQIGDDTLTGSINNDRISGGRGKDTISGLGGRDEFVFAAGDSGQSDTTKDTITDFAKGAVGVGDEIDFGSIMTIGGSNAAASANEASINITTAFASFAAGQGTMLADAISDIATRMTTATNTAGEFAIFKVNGAGSLHLFISDGVAGVGANDVVINLGNQTSYSTINLTSGDLTILS